VRTLEVLGEDLTALGHNVRYATPEGRFTLPLPTYPDIRLAFFPRTDAGQFVINLKSPSGTRI